ncbi:collagenase [Guptibacillus hwajinpoensis]|uniref:collagenase n=1 Tax=Guptibacillus hwajinpoensis TaxID=208199 RepID=UPI003D08BD7E
MHEFAHYALDRKVESTTPGLDPYPLWFQEGVAEYIANDQTIVEASDFELVNYDQLKSYQQWKTARKQDGTDVYDQSYFTIKFLIDESGENVIEDIINATSNSGDFKRSLEDVTGLRYDTLLKRLKITLEN